MVTRRSSLVALAGTLAGLGATADARTQVKPGASSIRTARDNFQLSGTYLNGAYIHPLPLDAAAAARAYITGRCDPSAPAAPKNDAHALFAQLINADPSEIAGVPSTSFAESFVAASLGLFEDQRAKIVTDILHHDGSLYMYGELAKAGNPLKVIPMGADGRIDMNRFEAAIDADTRLVAISLVSWINGFQHDLSTVCEIAHRKGAKVFVDAIQGAGAVPIDVKTSGVDFLACSTFKWLMGDFGYGYLYVRRDQLPLLERRQFGYHQIKSLDYHSLPLDPPGPEPFVAVPDNRSAAGYFEVGSMGKAAQAASAVSLNNLLTMGVENIQRERQPLMDRLRDGLSGKYRPLTPAGATSPIIAFALADAETHLAPRLREAQINISLYNTRFRVSPSIYNTLDDVEALIDVLTA